MNRLGLLKSGSIIDLNDEVFTKSVFRGVTDMNSLIEGGDRLLFAIKDMLHKRADDITTVDVAEVKLLSPIFPRRNIICVGKNYREHVVEINNTDIDNGRVGHEMPKEYPIFFTKGPGTVVAHNEAIESHPNTTKYLDYEAELAVIIGKKGRDISAANWKEHVFGYTIANDVSARDVQRQHSQYFKGKTLDSTCPLGPSIVHASDLDPSDLSIKLWLNDTIKQDSRTSKMIFKIPELIQSLSEGFTLLPGDVLLTGTPEGVGYGHKPPLALVRGDRVRIEIEHIGVLENHVD